jgi:hypothetical protein
MAPRHIHSRVESGTARSRYSNGTHSKCSWSRRPTVGRS